MNKFLLNRVKNDVILLVNKYRKYNRFIFLRKEYKCISEMNNKDFIDFFINKKFNYINTRIIQQEIFDRFSKKSILVLHSL